MADFNFELTEDTPISTVYRYRVTNECLGYHSTLLFSIT
jgi:hypothetical protein